MNSTAEGITKILRDQGPSFSKDLVRSLEVSGVSPAAARQRISRAKFPVCRLENLSLPRKEQFLYLDDQEGGSRFYSNLMDGLSVRNSSYYYPIRCIAKRGGAIYRDYFDVVSAAPYVKVKKQVVSHDILNSLTACGLIVESIDRDQGVISLRGFDVDFNSLIGRDISEKALLLGLEEYLVNIGIVSSGAISVRGHSEELPSSGAFRWDMSGPSYIWPLTALADGHVKQGAFVCDVDMVDDVDVNYISYFVKKCEVLSKSMGNRRILPMYICGGLQSSALYHARKKGIIVGTPDSIFGSGTKRALFDVIDIFRERNFTDDVFARRVNAVFDGIGRIEATASHLRGHLFEYLVSHIITLRERVFPVVGRLVRDRNGKSAEIDVFYSKYENVVCCECKAFLSKNLVAGEYIKRWFEEKFPIITGWFKKSHYVPDGELEVQFWSVTGFDNDALEYLKSKKDSLNKVVLSWYGKEEVISFAGEFAKPMLKIINEQYLNNPVSVSGK